MKGLSLLGLAALCGGATSRFISSPDEVNERSVSALRVTLEMAGNTQVKATLANTGESPLKLLRVGSFLDSGLVEKVQVWQAGKFHVDIIIISGSHS